MRRRTWRDNWGAGDASTLPPTTRSAFSRARRLHVGTRRSSALFTRGSRRSSKRGPWLRASSRGGDPTAGGASAPLARRFGLAPLSPRRARARKDGGRGGRLCEASLTSAAAAMDDEALAPDVPRAERWVAGGGARTCTRSARGLTAGARPPRRRPFLSKRFLSSLGRHAGDSFRSAREIKRRADPDLRRRSVAAVTVAAPRRVGRHGARVGRTRRRSSVRNSDAPPPTRTGTDPWQPAARYPSFSTSSPPPRCGQRSRAFPARRRHGGSFPRRPRPA